MEEKTLKESLVLEQVLIKYVVLRLIDNTCKNFCLIFDLD